MKKFQTISFEYSAQIESLYDHRDGEQANERAEERKRQKKQDIFLTCNIFSFISTFLRFNCEHKIRDDYPIMSFVINNSFIYKANREREN